jgi:hypothetical protein
VRHAAESVRAADYSQQKGVDRFGWCRERRRRIEEPPAAGELLRFRAIGQEAVASTPKSSSAVSCCTSCSKALCASGILVYITQFVGIEVAQETPPLARFGYARLGVVVQRPVLRLLGRLHIDSDIDSPIANVQRSLGLADEHDVDLDSILCYLRRGAVFRP